MRMWWRLLLLLLMLLLVSTQTPEEQQFWSLVNHYSDASLIDNKRGNYLMNSDTMPETYRAVTPDVHYVATDGSILLGLNEKTGKNSNRNVSVSTDGSMLKERYEFKSVKLKSLDKQAQFITTARYPTDNDNISNSDASASDNKLVSNASSRMKNARNSVYGEVKVTTNMEKTTASTSHCTDAGSDRIEIKTRATKNAIANPKNVQTDSKAINNGPAENTLNRRDTIEEIGSNEETQRSKRDMAIGKDQSNSLSTKRDEVEERKNGEELKQKQRDKEGEGTYGSFVGSTEETELSREREQLKLRLARLELQCRLLMKEDAEWEGCPRVWDKVLCWSPATPGSEVRQPCPTHIPGMENEGEAVRLCESDGRWRLNPHLSLPPSPDQGIQNDTNGYERDNSTHFGSASRVLDNEASNPSITPGNVDLTSNDSLTNARSGGNEGVTQTAGWTDYSQCLQAENDLSLLQEWLPFVKITSLIGYSISLGLLLISFVVLASLKRLRCPRNLLHLHLFASFILRAVVVLLRSSLLSASQLTPAPTHTQLPSQVRESNSWWCRLVIVIWQYFITANYSWILMEGLYLHNLIFRALFTDSTAITLYVLLGWGLPMLFVGSWACVRFVLDNSHCWMLHGKPWVFMVLIRIPVAFSVFLNFFFFVNVVRVLTLKLRSSVSDESKKYRKLAKSTLVLVPLFGAHYCLLWGLSTSTHPTVELAWLLMDQVFASFQGFFVAVLYCLINGEVRQELRKIYYNRFGGGIHTALATGQSTVVSHSRIYTSRTTRASLHSIHSMTGRERQSPSPQALKDGDDRDDVSGKEAFVRFSPSPEKRKMMEVNSVTEELVELRPLHQSNNIQATETGNIHSPTEEIQPLLIPTCPTMKMVCISSDKDKAVANHVLKTNLSDTPARVSTLGYREVNRDNDDGAMTVKLKADVGEVAVTKIKTIAIKTVNTVHDNQLKDNYLSGFSYSDVNEKSLLTLLENSDNCTADYSAGAVVENNGNPNGRIKSNSETKPNGSVCSGLEEVSGLRVDCTSDAKGARVLTSVHKTCSDELSHGLKYKNKDKDNNETML